MKIYKWEYGNTDRGKTDGEGFGFTSRIDLERLLAERFLLRWTGLGTISQDTEGVKWFSNATLYQNLGDGRAFHREAATGP